VTVQIFNIIETLKQDIKTLEELVQQVMSSEEDSVQDIIVDAEVMEEDKKPAARKPTKAERREKGKQKEVERS
jgi:hypothetical protein